MRSGLLAVAVFAIACSGAARAEVVGTYICAMDNCGKSFSQQGGTALDACKAGVSAASDSQPSSPGCLSMCDSTYTGEGGRSACRKGCGMFPDACLRDGKVSPEEPGYGKTRKAWKPPKQPRPAQRRYRNSYRYWY
jgi:hypothetical protein